MPIALAGFAFLLMTSDPAAAPTTPFTAQHRVTEAIAAIRLRAWRSDAVDWPAVEARARVEASTARDTIDLLPVYSHLLEALGDHHSFVQADPALRASYKDRYGREFDADIVRAQPTSGFTARRDRIARRLTLPGAARVELITAPKVFGDGQDAKTYADVVFSNVAAAADAACGYVVDLRGNVGGNIWPMKAGLSALLGESYLNTDPYARFDRGAFLINEGPYKDQVAARITDWRSLPELAQTPVAILIDDGVGSSGEGVAVAFRGRPSTRFFGQTSAGVASTNEGFRLTDGVNLVVTTSLMTDRNGRSYPDGIEPDEPVPAGEGSVVDADDAVVEAAKAWLAGQGSCVAKPHA